MNETQNETATPLKPWWLRGPRNACCRVARMDVVVSMIAVAFLVLTYVLGAYLVSVSEDPRVSVVELVQKLKVVQIWASYPMVVVGLVLKAISVLLGVIYVLSRWWFALLSVYYCQVVATIERDGSASEEEEQAAAQIIKSCRDRMGAAGNIFSIKAGLAPKDVMG